MSSSNPSDPRLLLPEWLRDGDTPLPTRAESRPAGQPVVVAEIVEVVEAEPVIDTPIAVPVTPYSERLSLDTRLDPGALVSAEDLPSWLGGVERDAAPAVEAVAPARVAAATAPAAAAIEEPEPYDGVDAPEAGVIDVQVNGRYMIAGAIGLLILLAAALRLYLS
jgi:hypothetical protein